MKGRSIHRILAAAMTIAAFAGCDKPFSKTNAPDEQVADEAETTVGAKWTTSFEIAQQRAKETHRPILAYFTGSDWCSVCVRIDREVLRTIEFQKWAESNVILLELDFPSRKRQPKELKEQNKSLHEKFSIQGYPTMLVLDSSGNEIGRVVGYQGDAKSWRDEIEKVVKP